MTDWTQFNERMMSGVAECDPVFRPTNFWTPGLRELLVDLESRGLDTFKSWPSAGSWFYPWYGLNLRPRAIKALVDRAIELDDTLSRRRVQHRLNGVREAQRDFDAVRLAWDHHRWPFDLEGWGESGLGRPSQRFALRGAAGPRWSKPYLNYLLCLSALSWHVDHPPVSFLEVGGGYGVLGEVVMQRDPVVRYVNLDIPPLLTVSSYYLTSLFGHERVLAGDDLPTAGPVAPQRSACLPNWRIDDLQGDFDVFVNSFSFQEMEPHVVERYVAAVAGLGVEYVVSLNSRAGKQRAVHGEEGGVLEPVTSERITGMFQQHGYQVQGRYGEPLIRRAGEIVVLQRITE